MSNSAESRVPEGAAGVRRQASLPAIIVLATCIGLLGCKPREVPVEQEQLALSAALGVPVKRLAYEGPSSDPFFHYMRFWKILAEGQDLEALGLRAEPAGRVGSVAGQVCEYAPCTDRDLLRAPGPLPLTEAAARHGALNISRRLWPGAAADRMSVEVRSHGTKPGVVDALIPAWAVELTFPNAPRDTARYARITFVAADGTCDSIWARLWD